MFREMIRKNKALTREECAQILLEERRGVLSVSGDEGYPYGVPMNHYYNEEDGCIYFHQGKVGHRLDSVRANDKVSFTVIDKGASEENSWVKTFRSVIAFGRIEVIDDLETIVEMATKLSYKFTSDKAYIEGEIARFAKATLLLKLKIEHLTGKWVREE